MKTLKTIRLSDNETLELIKVKEGYQLRILKLKCADTHEVLVVYDDTFSEKETADYWIAVLKVRKLRELRRNLEQDKVKYLYHFKTASVYSNIGNKVMNNQVLKYCDFLKANIEKLELQLKELKNA